MDSGSVILILSLAAIVLYFLIEWVRLGAKLRGVRQSLHVAAQAVTEAQDNSNEHLSESELLNDAWLRYKRTFLADEGERCKTDADAETFFSESHVLSQRMNLRYWMAVPNLLVGMGILGTFIGLTFGVATFDTGSVEGVRSSIATLLAGMGTAFSTSIAGMLLSIFFNVYEKDRFKKISDDLRRLAFSLNGRYKLTTADRLRFRYEDEHRLMAEFFAYKTEDGHVVLPSHVLRDLRREAQEQTGALKSFSTDLADGIMISSQTIEALGSSLGEVFTAAMQTQLRPTMEGVEQAVQALKEEKSASNQDMVERVVDNLKGALEGMGQQFQQALSGGTVTQLEQVAATVGAAGDVLSSMPEKLEQIMSRLQQDLLDASVKTSEEAELSTMSMRQEAEKAAAAMRGEIEKVAVQFGQTVLDLQENTSKLLERQDQSTKSVEDIVTGVREVLAAASVLSQKLAGTTHGIEQALARIANVSSSLDGTAYALVTTGNQLKATTETFRVESATLQKANRENIDALRKALTEAQTMSTEYAQKFTVIGEALKGIFAEIDAGLNSYRSETRTSLNYYLGDFAEHLKGASHALSSSVSALSDSLEELNDTFDKLGRWRGNGQAPTT